MSPKDADGMANSVDSDQTRSSLIWVYTVCPGQSVRQLRIITGTNFFMAVKWYLILWETVFFKTRVTKAYILQKRDHGCKNSLQQ